MAVDDGGTVGSTTRSIRGRMASLVAEHLDAVVARRLEQASEVVAAGIGVGDDPVVLSDAVVDGVPGLWVLTTEQCLWEPADVLWPHDGIDRDWSGASAVDTFVRPDGAVGVAVTWPDAAAVFDAVGDPEWAAELAWAARQLAGIDGGRDRWCVRCRIPVGDAEAAVCVLCSDPLTPYPSHGPGVVSRRLAGREPASRTAVAAAEVALGDAFPWIVVPAALDGMPVVVVATDEWVRCWDAAGTCRLDLALEGVDAAAEPFDDGWEVAISRADGADVFLTGFDDADLAAEVAERISAPARAAASTADVAAALPPPPSAAHAPGPVGQGEELVRCPLCAEQIQAAAVLCRFCGARFTADARHLPQESSTNGLAIASLVLGLLWLYWLGSVLAIVFGYLAQSQIRRSGGRQGGRGMATAGIILGWVGLAVLVIGLVIVTDRA